LNVIRPSVAVAVDLTPNMVVASEPSVRPTDKQLADDAKPRQIFEQAKAAADEQMAEPVGKPLEFQDRPVVWCMVQAALGEAEERGERISVAWP
jgi:hypothetical protein